MRNALLLQLPTDDRNLLLDGAELVRLPVGETLARNGDAVSSAFFLDSGLVAMVSAMPTGASVGVATVGAEGAFGLGSLFNVPSYLYSMLVVVEAEAYRIPEQRLRLAFEQSDALRRILLSHFAVRIAELLAAVACQRVHSHAQRLARWLLIAVDKSGTRSLHITHDTLAGLVGGPRHAVTNALNRLRARGALTFYRRRIEVLDPDLLRDHVCECYLRPA